MLKKMDQFFRGLLNDEVGKGRKRLRQIGWSHSYLVIVLLRMSDGRLDHPFSEIAQFRFQFGSKFNAGFLQLVCLLFENSDNALRSRHGLPKGMCV
jgi:hypothetical protein